MAISTECQPRAPLWLFAAAASASERLRPVRGAASDRRDDPAQEARRAYSFAEKADSPPCLDEVSEMGRQDEKLSAAVNLYEYIEQCE